MYIDTGNSISRDLCATTAIRTGSAWPKLDTAIYKPLTITTLLYSNGTSWDDIVKVAPKAWPFAERNVTITIPPNKIVLLIKDLLFYVNDLIYPGFPEPRIRRLVIKQNSASTSIYVY